jgi:hypothetical protein
MIANMLKNAGLNFTVQSALTHNADKLAMPNELHINRLLAKETKIVIKEMRTF